MLICVQVIDSYFILAWPVESIIQINKRLWQGMCMAMQQEDIEESARAELWREELIEEIEQKVGGLRELEEAGKKK